MLPFLFTDARWSPSLGGGGHKHTTEKILVKEQHAEIQEVPAEAVPNAFTCRGVVWWNAILNKVARIFQLFGGIYILGD